MTDNDIIDVRESAEERRRAGRRRTLRRLLPLLAVVLMIGALFGIARRTFVANRADAVGLANGVVSLLAENIGAQVEAHLSPAAELVQLADDFYRVLKPPATEQAVRLFETMGLQFLEVFPQIKSFAVGTPNGDFLMTQRTAAGTVDTKLIRHPGGVRTTTWTRRDPSGGVLRIERDPKDTYDPRTRPWYTGATGAKGVYWTDAYIFFTSREPGVTAALAVRDDRGATAGVLSIDIDLRDLSHFLSGLEIGRTGRALIIDGQGQIVAYQDFDRILKQEDGNPRSAMVEELKDPVLTRAYDRFRIEGHGIRHISLDGRRYSSMTTSLRSLVGKNWTVLVTVPEDDFVGFVGENVREGLWMSLGVLGMATLMGGILLWQDVRSERRAERLLEKRGRIEAVSGAFAELTATISSARMGDDDPLERITETVSSTMGIRRVSLWRLSPEGGELVCRDAFDRESGGHTRGTVLTKAEFPALLAALRSGEDIRVTDASTDERTRALHNAYLSPLGCVALLSVPYRQPGGIAGAVWFEHDGAARGWSPEDSNLAHVVADTIFLRLTAEGRGAEGPPPAPAAGPTPPEGSAETAPGPAPACALKGLEGPMPLRDSLRTSDLRAVEIDALERRLSAQGKSRRDLASDVIDGISVMAIRFTDPVALSLPVPDDGDGSTVAAMACRIETIADEHGIEFVKMLGDLVVCATGFQDAGRPHAQRVSEAALAVQEDLQKAFSSLNTGMAFQIGIDTGSVIGSIVGCAHASYNIWGEAARGAVEMAQTASGGEIQVTEAAYTCLRSGYLFQLKGAYYVDRVGEMNTYLLTGRI